MVFDGSSTLSIASFSSRGKKSYTRITDDAQDNLRRDDVKRSLYNETDLEQNVTFDSDDWNPEAKLEDHPDDVPYLDQGPTFDESIETYTDDREFQLLEDEDDILEATDLRSYLDVIKQDYVSDDDSNDGTSVESSTTSVMDALAVEGPSIVCLDEDSLQQLALLGDQTGKNLAEFNKYLCKELEVAGFVETMKDFSEEVVTNGLNNIENITLPDIFTCLSLPTYVDDQKPRLVAGVSQDSRTEESLQSAPSKEMTPLPSGPNDASCEEPIQLAPANENNPLLAGPNAEIDEEPILPDPVDQISRQPSFSSFFIDSNWEEAVQTDPENEPVQQTRMYSAFFLDESCEDLAHSPPPQEASFSHSPPPQEESFSHPPPPQEESCPPPLSPNEKESGRDDESVQSALPKQESCLPMCFSSINDAEEGMEIPYVSCTGSHNTTDDTNSRPDAATSATTPTSTAEMKERQSILSKLLFGGQRKDNAKVAPAPVATPAPVVTGTYASRFVRPDVLRIQLSDGSMATISRESVARLSRCHWV